MQLGTDMAEKPDDPATPKPMFKPSESFLARRRMALPKLDMTPPTWKAAPHPMPENPRKFFSASVGGFFSEEIHGLGNLPKDAVEITPEEWRALLDAQGAGKQIVAGPKGRPVAVDPVMTPEMKRQSIELQIDQIRRSSEAIDAHRDAILGKQGAKERLAAIDAKMEALRATLPL